MKEIILHIGSHKTGSSAIQSALKKFDDGKTQYADFGTDTPGHSIPIRFVFNAKNNILIRRERLNKKEVLSYTNKFTTYLEKMIELSDRDRLIISGEAISTIEDDIKEKMIDYFLSKNLTLKVYCYVRNPISYSKSMFLQQILGGGRKALPKIISPNFKNRLEVFRKKLPKSNLKVKLYDRNFLHNSCVVQDFCKEIGIKLDFKKTYNRNISPTLPATKLIFLFNSLNIPSNGEIRLNKAMIKFRNMLKASYQNGEKLDDKYFGWMTDFSEIDYLKKEFDIKFSKSKVESNKEELLELLLENNDIDTKPIDNLLIKYKIDPSKFLDIKEKISLLYLGILAKWDEKA